MRTVVLLLIAVFAAGVLVGKKYGYQEGFAAHQQLPQDAVKKAEFLDTPEDYLAPVTIEPVSEVFQCDGRKHCSEMRSKAEAEYFLANCPAVKMDGDHDGVPCEQQFGY